MFLPKYGMIFFFFFFLFFLINPIKRFLKKV